MFAALYIVTVFSTEYCHKYLHDERMIRMKEIVTATEKVEKRMSLGLQSRLLYLLLKCPLLQQGQGCACKEASAPNGRLAGRQRRVHADDEEVILQVTVPYALRRAARAAHLDCSALTRKALAKQLKKAARD